MKDLYPGMKKKDLSIQQAKIVHKNVLRKKKRVLKRARFKFLPQLRDKEAQKFGGKDLSFARIPRKKDNIEVHPHILIYILMRIQKVQSKD